MNKRMARLYTILVAMTAAFLVTPPDIFASNGESGHGTGVAIIFLWVAVILLRRSTVTKADSRESS